MGKDGGGSQTTVQKSDPWSGVQPFLLGSQTRRLKPGVAPIYGTATGQTGQGLADWTRYGGNLSDYLGNESGMQLMNPDSDYETVGSSGVYPEAQRLYSEGNWSPSMDQNNQALIRNLQQRQQDQIYSDIGDMASAVLHGQYDPDVQRVGRITGAQPVTAAQISGADRINAQQVDPRAAWASMGQANPTESIAQMLSGQVNTATLDPVVSNAMRRLGEGFSEQVMPSIRAGAEAAGQYGGSRQGIAEGLASRGLAYSMGDLADNLYNQAYQQAQQNMYGTANNVAGLSLNNAQSNAAHDLTAQTSNAQNQLNAQMFNASAQNDMARFNAANDLSTQQFNANLGLQNNSQAIANSQAIMNNRAQGLNFLNAGNGMQDQQFQALQNAYNIPNEYNWRNLTNYASIIQPGSGIGGTTSTEQPNYSNPAGSALGGALAGAQIAGLLGVGSGWGAGAGALLGLLSDRRFKTDIEPVGRMDNGLTVYRYRYKAGGPMMLGVMADEVKAVNPGAVINADGVDYVNYGRL